MTVITSLPKPLVMAWRLAAVLLLGFASGLPLALTGQAMQAWLSAAQIDLATIGFLSLVGLPYTFKFLWAPLMDRFEPPILGRLLGRRRGWLVITQLGLAAALSVLAATSPSQATQTFAWLAVLVAFLSASQDVVIDAYRTDLLPMSERGLGSSLSVLGYRLAMIVSGGVVLIWTDPSNVSAGVGWSWPQVYQLMAAVMLGAALVSWLGLPRLSVAPAPHTSAWRELRGFVAVAAAVAAGAAFTQMVIAPLAHAWLLPPIGPAGTGASVGTSSALSPPSLAAKWLDLLVLLIGLVLTAPLAAWAARAARFETLLSSLRSYFSQGGAGAFLAFIVLYKLGDAFAGSLMTPFLLQGLHYAPAEVGVVNKVVGIWLTIGGALLGGALMLKLKLWRALMLFGVLQMASNLGFWWLAMGGQNTLPGLTLPAFDLGFVHLAQPTPVDGGLLMVVAIENLSSGMGTAAFVAFLMSLCNQRYTATQYALLSAFASVGRVWVGPLAGVLVQSIGWPHFFMLSIGAAMPALWLLWRLKSAVQALEFNPKAPAADT